MDRERRKSSRAQVRAKAYILGEAGLSEAEILNLSSGGVLLRCSLAVDKGDDVSVAMEFSRVRRPVRLMARVIHTASEGEGKQRAGLKFTNASPAIEDLIQREVLRALESRERARSDKRPPAE